MAKVQHKFIADAVAVKDVLGLILFNFQIYLEFLLEIFYSLKYRYSDDHFLISFRFYSCKEKLNTRIATKLE